MISDTLSEAVEDIRRYLDEPIFADVYQGAVRQQIEELVAAMDATRVLLDTPPPVSQKCVICNGSGECTGPYRTCGACNGSGVMR